MTFTIMSKLKDSGNRVLYNPRFRTVIETHLPILRVAPVATVQPISPDKIHQYESDFYGLLNELGIPMEMHWVYLRVNGLFNPTDFGRETHDPYRRSIRFNLLHPSMDYLTELVMLFTSTQSRR